MSKKYVQIDRTVLQKLFSTHPSITKLYSPAVYMKGSDIKKIREQCVASDVTMDVKESC